MGIQQKISMLVVALMLIINSFAQQIPSPPSPPRLVNDFTKTLTADQIVFLEKKLVALDDSTSSQIAIVLIPSLEGADISDYALKLGRSWGIGGKEHSNGVVVLVAINDRKINISPGYGLEGALPDITCKHIIDEVIKPSFKGQDYFRGLDEGTNAIIKAIKGEYKVARKKGGKSTPVGIIIAIAITIIILSLLSGGRGGGTYSGGRGFRRGWGGPVIFPMGGGWGGSGGGNSGGGGFGGFGGGSFGGGGASGGW